MRRLYEANLWFIAPGDLIAYGAGVKGRNRHLVRILVNGFFWIAVVVVGLATLSMTGTVHAAR
jgi:hypothetical protein